jgi:hypothetical protein
LIEQQALLRLLEALNEPQTMILMSHGNFDGTFNDPPLQEFYRQYPGVFSVEPPTFESSPDESRHWAMFRHYEDELVARGLLCDTEGIDVRTRREDEKCRQDSDGRQPGPRRWIATTRAWNSRSARERPAEKAAHVVESRRRGW